MNADKHPPAKEARKQLKLVASYAALVGVNVVFGAGLFGVPTNKDISDAYPSVITPAGFTFAIWGPIFLLEGAGVAVMALTSNPVARRAAGAWMGCWAAECVWQFVFAQAPIPASAASPATKLCVLIPAAALLFTAQGSMLRAAAQLRFAPPEDDCPRTMAWYASRAAGALFVDLPTGLNAGWLAAAAGIGTTLVAKNVPALSVVAEPRGGAMLLTAVSCAGALLSVVFGSKAKSMLVGVGYAAATAWACYGITKADGVSREVEAAAAQGITTAACGAAVAIGCALGNTLLKPRQRAVEGASDHAQKKPLLH